MFRSVSGAFVAAAAVSALVAGAGADPPPHTCWQHDPATPGDWFEGANWTAGVPDGDDYADINSGGAAGIASGDAEALELNLGYSAGDLGTVSQTGGTHTVNGLYVGRHSGGEGRYYLSGAGSLSAVVELIGYYGTGTFLQTGGTNTVGGINGNLFLGYEAGGSGSYGLSGTGSLGAKNEWVGHMGEGWFSQSGGTNTVNGVLNLAGWSGATGTYELSGTGSLSAENEFVGKSGTGVFTQTGGTHAVTGTLRVGRYPVSRGTYTMSGGSLAAGSLIVGDEGKGALNISGACAEVAVSEVLRFGPLGRFTAVAGSAIHMTGSDFENWSASPADLAGLANLELIFEGGPGSLDSVEAAGQDVGAVAAGWTKNFALGGLTLGGAAGCGRIELVDECDNLSGDEALYVDALTLNAGAHVELNDLNLYYRNGIGPKRLAHGDSDLDGDVDATDLAGLGLNWDPSGSGANAWGTCDFDGDGDVDASDLAQIGLNWNPSGSGGALPEPGALARVAAGLAAMMARRKRR